MSGFFAVRIKSRESLGVDLEMSPLLALANGQNSSKWRQPLSEAERERVGETKRESEKSEVERDSAKCVASNRQRRKIVEKRMRKSTMQKKKKRRERERKRDVVSNSSSFSLKRLFLWRKACWIFSS